MPTYTPYTYLIGWSTLNKFYYGVRYAHSHNCIYESGCHPNDLFVTYFTSSETVVEYINIHGKPDIIQIRKTFPDKQSACEWEEKVLRRMKVVARDDFLNKHDRHGPPLNIGRKDSIETRALKRNRMIGDKNHMYGVRGHAHHRYGTRHSDVTKEKISKKNKGVNHPFYGIERPDHSEKISGPLHFNYGKTLRDDTRKKISESAMNKPKIKCMYCDFEHHVKGHVVRYHNDNCKHKPL